MLFPPSLSADLLARSFRATNGELGVLLIDATAFLDACDADDVAVLGWELWLVDHGWDRSGQPCLAPGYWIGVIPTRDGSGSVIGGSGNSDCTRNDVATLDLQAIIEDRWLPFVRINFTLGA
ncbi:hypothetical protein [Mycoplana sp. MJR14]|uniref:hypothetical protein n=1 Tax=Mycoplana sp. MJR14 TaxID=3032583 RepID=UPI000DD946F3|nr:hypothetical protein [Mycoplana sp. MJR14]MDF1633952.1 hypothetical protein [Mycoplana sp. MJR14]